MTVTVALTEATLRDQTVALAAREKGLMSLVQKEYAIMEVHNIIVYICLSNPEFVGTFAVIASL